MVYEQKGATKKYILAITLVLLVGIITASMAYRGSITSRITGEATKGGGIVTEGEAATMLIKHLQEKYGEAKFFRSQDLGSLYLIVVEHDGEQFNFYVSKDGKYFSNTIEEITTRK
jgi:hypothetical protein